MTSHNRMIMWFSILCFVFISAFPISVNALNDPRPRRAGLKIEISGSGICRLTGNDIQKAGVNPAAIDPSTLRMFRMDQEIPLIVSSTGSSFGTSDSIEFYVQGIDNQYTGTDVYWLYWGGDAGQRMAWVNGTIIGSPAVVTTFNEIFFVEENKILWAETPNAPIADYWFWEKFTSPQTATYTFNIFSRVDTSADAVITVYFQGRTGDSSIASHHTVVTLNGNKISDDVWQGELAHVQTGVIQQNLLVNGQNQIKIQCLQVAGLPDVVYFNRIELDYQRKLTAIDNELRFSLDQNSPVQVDVGGFTGQSIRMFDISNPSAVKRISNIEITSDQTGFKASFAHPGGEKEYLAIGAGSVLTPDRISYRKPSDLKNKTNSADYILITGKDFMAALENLAELRRRQEMTVKMVDIEEIYDIFSFGFFDPEAIRGFLQYAYQNWDLPAPQYVLLAGDANLDYRHYFETSKKKNIVPVYLDKTSELGLTPSDNRYGCVQGDDELPELYVGRIPGDSSATITSIVNKLIRYESTKHINSTRVLFTADNDDIAFETLNDTLAAYLSGQFFPEKIYSRFYSNLDTVTQDILTVINSGAAMVNFVGHGDVTRWGAEPAGGGDFIIEPDDIDSLNNVNRLTFIVALDCLNGYFSQPFQYSLAEEWVMAPSKGAVACLAPSGLSHQQEHEVISYQIFSKIFLESENRLGLIATQSKIDAYYEGASDKVLISFNLIGDPATRLAINRKASDLVTVHSIMAAATAGGAVSPAGETIVFDRASQAYTITPSAGYTISSVTVDGTPQGQINAYTFNNVTADHTISVAFDQEGGSGGGGGGGGCFVMTVRK